MAWRTASTRPAPYREPLAATLARTGGIAVVLGAVLSAWSGLGIRRWPVAALLMLWPALGGHFVELLFLNWLRPRIGTSRTVQVIARLLVWFVGGCVLLMGARLTAATLGITSNWTHAPWWIGGLAFIGLELIVHVVLQLRQRGSFYNGRG